MLAEEQVVCGDGALDGVEGKKTNGISRRSERLVWMSPDSLVRRWRTLCCFGRNGAILAGGVVMSKHDSPSECLLPYGGRLRQCYRLTRSHNAPTLPVPQPNYPMNPTNAGELTESQFPSHIG
jgi:hypothetical protein